MSLIYNPKIYKKMLKNQPVSSPNLIEYRTLLERYLPTDLVNKIEAYYMSSFHYENIIMPIKYPASYPYEWMNLYGAHIYYMNPFKYLMNVSFDRTKTKRDRIINMCRYWIYNSDLIFKSMSFSEFKRLEWIPISLLMQTLAKDPSWDEGYYYYSQIRFISYLDD